LIRDQKFNRRYIEMELEKLNAALTRRTRVFVAGGAAMAFYGLKEATKDIDVVVEKRTELHSLVSALRALGYKRPTGLVETTYAKMRASAILENTDGFRWDVFERVIARKLSLSKGMISRSRILYDETKLHLRALSKEDIFLLKSITGRDLDLEDMRIVAESGINWNDVKIECQAQASRTGRIWEDALCEKLIELGERMKIAAPIEKSICEIADQKILENWIIRKVGTGINTVKDLARTAGEPESAIREAISRLIRKGNLSVDRSKRMHRFRLPKRRKTHIKRHKHRS
jgi:hypothetical protein